MILVGRFSWKMTRFVGRNTRFCLYPIFTSHAFSLTKGCTVQASKGDFERNWYLLPRGDSWTWNPHLSDPAIIPVELSSHVFGWYILDFLLKTHEFLKNAGRVICVLTEMTLRFPNIPYKTTSQEVKQWKHPRMVIHLWLCSRWLSEEIRQEVPYQPTNFGDGSGFCWKVRVLVSLGTKCTLYKSI